MKYTNGEPPEYWLSKAKEAPMESCDHYIIMALQSLLEERAAQPVFAVDGFTADQKATIRRIANDVVGATE